MSDPASNLNVAGLSDLFRQLHQLPASSRKREYWRGRIDEFLAQNAVSDTEQALARAEALSELAAD